MQDLVLIGGDAAEAQAVTDPQALYVSPTPAQRLMKPVDAAIIGQVLANRPMPRIPRGGYERPADSQELIRRVLERTFPQFYTMHQSMGGSDIADTRFDAVIADTVKGHRDLGMSAQAQKMEETARSYKNLRSLLTSEEDLVTPETFIPIQYLPDLFMAVPVWYFWADKRTQEVAREAQVAPDPKVHAHLQHICDLIPTGRWADTFLMYNRRMRTLPDYTGDMVPPHLIERIQRVALLFDYLVIMTPYHDVAGKDWGDLQWLRSLDPYVVGFCKALPYMFVVGRFSDSGTFPLYSELVADTIAFLRSNVEKLKGFSEVSVPFWYGPSSKRGVWREDSSVRLGQHLIEHTKKLLAAFDASILFDWLRGEAELPNT